MWYEGRVRVLTLPIQASIRELKAKMSSNTKENEARTKTIKEVRDREVLFGGTGWCWWGM